MTFLVELSYKNLNNSYTVIIYKADLALLF